MDQKKPVGINAGIIVLAILLPIFLIFVGSILLTKYIIRNKNRNNGVTVHPEHQESRKIVEVDYEKMAAKPLPAMQTVQVQK